MKTRLGTLFIGATVLSSALTAWLHAEDPTPPHNPSSGATPASAADIERAKRETERMARREQDRAKRETDLNTVWSSLTLEEKAQMVKLFQGVKELPREEAKTIEDGISQFMRLPPDVREAVRGNYRIWMNMTPQQRDDAREEYRRLKREFEARWKKEHPDTEPPAFPFRLHNDGTVVSPPKT